MGEKGPGRDAQLRERGGIWYGTLERGGGVWRLARHATNGGGQRSAWRVSRGGGILVHGPCLESVGRSGKKGNGLGPGRIVPCSIYSNISKRLELIQSKCVLSEF
jgi:hypothetical protein